MSKSFSLTKQNHIFRIYWQIFSVIQKYNNVITSFISNTILKNKSCDKEYIGLEGIFVFAICPPLQSLLDLLNLLSKILKIIPVRKELAGAHCSSLQTFVTLFHKQLVPVSGWE